MFRCFCLALSFFASSIFGEADFGLLTEVEYGGLTIYCKSGCGRNADPNMKKIWQLLEPTVRQALEKCKGSFLDQNTNEQIAPWGIADDFKFKVYDWHCTEGKWAKNNAKLLSIRTHVSFKELAGHLHRDLHYYYLVAPEKTENLLEALKTGYKEGYRFVQIADGKIDFGYDEVFEEGRLGSNLKIEIESRSKNIQCIEKQKSIREENYWKALRLVDSSTQPIEALYRKVFVNCLENHQKEGSKFKISLENLLMEDFEEAFIQICFLINLAENNCLGSDLLSKLYLLKGQVQSEFGLYADAISTLTTSIQHNPLLKDAYFERAVAYFELGEFEKATENYLLSKSDQPKGYKETAANKRGKLHFANNQIHKDS